MTDPLQGVIKPRRVLVTGSRYWEDQAPIYRALYYQRLIAGERPMVVVHGAATGADSIAHRWAQTFYPGSVTPEPHPADWDHCRPQCRHKPRRRADGKLYCPVAGFCRNQNMVDLGADVCLAFPFPDSHGTADCAQRARAAGILVEEHPGHVLTAAVEVTP